MTVNGMINEIARRALGNLSSELRVFVLEFYRERAQHLSVRLWTPRQRFLTEGYIARPNWWQPRRCLGTRRHPPLILRRPHGHVRSFLKSASREPLAGDPSIAKT
jgi:hypothetical protein